MKILARILALGLLANIAAVSIGYATPPVAPLGRDPLIRTDWQDPHAMPRQFRNHCFTDIFSGRPICSNHCGLGYEFYYCSRQSFGCCSVGFGYCDWNGLLRCHP